MEKVNGLGVRHLAEFLEVIQQTIHMFLIKEGE